MLAPSAAIVLRVAGIAFLNAFIKSAPRSQTKLYIQVRDFGNIPHRIFKYFDYTLVIMSVGRSLRSWFGAEDPSGMADGVGLECGRVVDGSFNERS